MITLLLSCPITRLYRVNKPVSLSIHLFYVRDSNHLCLTSHLTVTSDEQKFAHYSSHHKTEQYIIRIVARGRVKYEEL